MARKAKTIYHCKICGGTGGGFTTMSALRTHQWAEHREIFPKAHLNRFESQIPFSISTESIGPQELTFKQAIADLEGKRERITNLINTLEEVVKLHKEYVID